MREGSKWKEEGKKPLLMSSWVKLVTGPFTDTRALFLPVFSIREPTLRSLVRVNRSFRFSESMSVPFRCCSVILDEEPARRNEQW